MTRFAAGAYVIVEADSAEEAQERLRALTSAEDRPVAIVAGVEVFIDASEVEDVSHGDQAESGQEGELSHVKHVPKSAWTLIPPGDDLCEVCGTDHRPDEPHNPNSLYWQTARSIAGEAMPTWDEALAHVDDETHAAWRVALSPHGVEVAARARPRRPQPPRADDEAPA